MLSHPAESPLHHNPAAYWCPDCWKWRLDCSHLVDPLDSPYMPLNHWQYLGVTWKAGVLQVTMNTGERYQHFGVSRNMAIRFARNPEHVLLKGFRFESPHVVVPVDSAVILVDKFGCILRNSGAGS